MDRPDLDYAGLFDASPNPYLVLDRGLNIVGANRAYLDATKRELADIVGRWAWDAFPTDPETLRQSIDSFQRVLRTGRPDTMALLRFDIPRPEAEGGGFEERYWSIVHAPVPDDVGEVALVLQHPIDVTELKRLRDAVGVQLAPAQGDIFGRARAVHEANLTLQAEGERLRGLFEQAPGFMCVLRGPEHRFELANAAYTRLVGRRDLVGKPVRAALPELEGQGFFELLDRVFATGEPFVGRGMEIAVQATPDAAPETRFVDFVYQPIADGDGRVSGIFVQGGDVTAAKRDADALRAERDRSRGILESMAEGFLLLDRSFRVIEANAEAARLDGRPREALIGRTHRELWPASRGTPVEAAYRRALDERTPAALEHHYVGEGHDRWLELRAYPSGDGLAVFFRDIGDRKRAEAALREGEARLREINETLEHRVEARARELANSEARFRAYFDASPEYLFLARVPPGGLVFHDLNPAAEALYGLPRAAVVGRSPAEVLDPVTAADVERRARECLRLARPVRYEAERRFRSGCPLVLDVVAAPLPAPEGGDPLVLFCGRDLTEQRRAEEALRHAQKMEAVGQLTGGIAHDFNNMLQGVGGAVELLRRRVAQGRAGDADRLGEMAAEGVKRAAALTHRLLAFARRQALDARPVELDGVVRGLAELVRRTVGPDIAVGLRLGDGAWQVLCDANQLENALLNLAINARDAMPGGGTLALSTADVRLSAAEVAGQDGAEPGDYVEVCVSDTGTGMTPDVMAHAFEPFFTTKPIGQGTGLGLSQIYGFVHQSGGFVRLDSAPGRGTTVRLYLPRHAGDAAVPEAAAPEQAEARAGAAGTVLLVEDEAGVRAVAAERLRELGHAVLEAGDGPTALRLLRTGARVDVLVTDVGLPGGMNGRQVADAARERRPGLPVLFITGYAGVALEGRLAPGMEVIGKPFALDALAAKVRAMLEPAPVA